MSFDLRVIQMAVQASLFVVDWGDPEGLRRELRLETSEDFPGCSWVLLCD